LHSKNQLQDTARDVETLQIGYSSIRVFVFVGTMNVTIYY